MEDRDEPPPRAQPSNISLDDTGIAPSVDATKRASDELIRPPGILTGTVVAGRFETRGELGRGAFGSVHRAFDAVSHDDVAIKIIPVPDPALADRVRREVRAARRVTHPNVVRVHDIVEDGTTLVLSMELVRGQSLDAWIAKSSERDPQTLLRMAREISAGVAAAHAAGVIHRDLKPANVMVREGSDTCLVTDFGVARPMDGEGAMDATRAGELIGTPLYMAPEQLDGSTNVGAPADVYALGLVFYELATGARPHSAKSLVGLAKLRSDAAAVPDLAAVPAPLRSIVTRCLAPLAADRYPDAGALARAFDSVGSQPVVAPPAVAVPASAAPRTRSKRPIALAAAVVATVALAGIGALVLHARSRTPELRPPARVRVLEASAGDDDKAWLDRTANAWLRYLLEGQGVTFSLVHQGEPADLVIGVHTTASPSGITIDVSTGTSEQALAPFAHHEGHDLDIVARSALEVLRLINTGRREREPTQDERARMKAIGAESLSAYLFYQRGLDTAERHLFELAEKRDPTWPHLHAALAYVDRINGRAPTPPDEAADPARDPLGHELIALLANAGDLADPARIQERLPQSKCADSDALCRNLRIQFARLTDEQMLGEAQQLCGTDFTFSAACAEVAAILARSDNAGAADMFLADWRIRRPHDTTPIVLGAVSAIRKRDFESTRTAVRRLALINIGTLAQQSALSIAIGDYATAATAATKLMAFPDVKTTASYHVATVRILQGNFTAAIGLLRELTADSVTLMQDYTFEALIDLYEGLGDKAEAARTIDRWFASPNPPTDLKAAVRRFQRDLLVHTTHCPRVDDVLVKIDPSLRDLVGQTLRRIAAAHDCLPCATTLADGTGGFHRTSSNVAFARCALGAGSLEIAEKIFTRESVILMSELDPGALVSPFSSAVARLHLAETHLKQGKKEEARQELDAFLAAWKDADRPLPQIELAKKLRATL